MNTHSTLCWTLLCFATPAFLGQLLGCAKPVIIDQPNSDDGGTDLGTDGSTNGLSVFSARLPDTFEFPSEYKPIPPEAQRYWKRDPHYLSVDGSKYLFIAGSDANRLNERWSLSFYKDPAMVSKTSGWALMFDGPSSTSWDKNDVMAPFVSFNVVDGWTTYYAASGDPTKPPWVFQIGRAVGIDLTKLARAPQPVIGTPAYTGDVPNTARPDAYGATDPWLFVDGGDTYMYYAGLDCATGSCKFQILRSKSPDGGKSFPPGEVVLSGRGVPEEAGGVAGPSVVKLGSQYLLAYTAVKDVPTKSLQSIRDALSKATVGLAVSKDGKTFQPGTKTGGALVPRLAGITSYRSEGTSSPTLYVENQTVYGWVSGRKDDSDGNYYGIVSMFLTENP